MAICCANKAMSFFGGAICFACFLGVLRAFFVLEHSLVKCRAEGLKPAPSLVCALLFHGVIILRTGKWTRAVMIGVRPTLRVVPGVIPVAPMPR
jgi:hypothetical protein